MNENERAAREWDRTLDGFAAELTSAAYAVALRHRAGAPWVDLELGLWKALAETVRQWDRALIGREGRRAPRTGPPFRGSA
jgi:hypothetical protein